MKIVVFTLGCKVNFCESASIINALELNGHDVSDKLSFADVYIINTCAVTSEAEKKSRQAIARVKRFNSNAKILVVGCASQNNPNAFLEKGASVVMGTFSKQKIVEMIDELGCKVYPETDEFEQLCPVKETKSRAYVKIQDGCNNFCSYCLIPYLRGRSRSRSVLSIKNELDLLTCNEVVLTGINLSAYNYNGIDLRALIKELYSYDFRIRLGSLEIGVINEEFLLALKGLKKFAPHFHLSLQSGSDKVLLEMNRHYTTKEYLNAVKLIRKHFPSSAITTDVIIGYSTENNSDFEESYDTCKKAQFADIHAFTFSPRKGTKAYELSQIPNNVKNERLEKMLEFKAKLKLEFARSQVGNILEFLPEEEVDGYAVGYTENYLRVYVKCKVEDKFIKVKIIEPYLDGAKAEII